MVCSGVCNYLLFVNCVITRCTLRASLSAVPALLLKKLLIFTIGTVLELLVSLRSISARS